MPKSPCSASTLLSTTLVDPVLVSVAEIFWPTLPDLPMPTTISFPRWRSVSTTSSTASSNAPSSCARTALSAANLDVKYLAGLGQMTHPRRMPGKPGHFNRNKRQQLGATAHW